jgi:hypothetical protein
MKPKTDFSKFLIFLLLFSFSNCNNKSHSENPKKDIIGKWESADKTLILEFKTDQKLYAEKHDGSFSVDTNSDIVFINDSTLLATWERNLSMYEIRVYSRHFILLDAGGKKQKFKRIN